MRSFLLIFLFCWSEILADHVFISNSTINNVVFTSEKIYVGSVNRLFSLSLSDLSLLHTVSTGPIKDSPLCSQDGSSCLRNAVPVLTDNHNKLLQFLPEGVLLVCGSTRQGVCSYHTEADLSVRSTGDVAVAANSPNASTVALVLGGNRLVVAASGTGDSPYRTPFPAVSLRILPDLHVVNSGSLEGEAAVFLRADFRSSFRVSYKKAFHHQHFVFILAVQDSHRQARNNPQITKLIRFCDNDTRFASYSEIELQCRTEDNSNFPVLTSAHISGDNLIGAFASSSGERHAVCLFSLQRIKLVFWYNIDRCRSGTDSIGLPHVGRDSKCINKSRVPLDEDTCELGVGGAIEAVEAAAAEGEGTVVAMTLVQNPRVLVVANDKGQIVMMKWKSGGLEEYFRRPIGEKGPVSQLQVIGANLILVLRNSIISQPLTSCEGADSCSACLISPDPLCLWCHSSTSCTTQSLCPHKATVNICPMQDGPPNPLMLAVGDSRNISVPIKHLPQPKGFKYECVFGRAVSIGQWTSEGVVCEAPVLDTVDEAVTTSSLAVKTSISQTPFITHKFSFFDCRKLSTCSSCLKSGLDCGWCISEGRCTRKGNCKGKTSSECVSISVSDLRIPSGSRQSVTLKVKNKDLLPRGSLTCRVQMLEAELSSPGRVDGGSVVCGPMVFNYKNSSGSIVVPIQLLQGKTLLDASKVTVFDCSRLAADCSSCVSLPTRWGCGWCSGRCSHQCSTDSPTVCDRPRILNFRPRSGPLEGGTLVRIEGRDLGSSPDDVRDRVWVGGAKCRLQHYEISRLIICVTSKGSSSGPVRVAVGGGGASGRRIAESQQFFSYLQPSIQSLYPLFGPLAGGTKVTVYGQNLNIGSKAAVHIGDVPCKVIQRNSSISLTCITSSVSTVGKRSKVQLSIDEGKASVKTSWEVRPDPVVHAVHPLIAFRSGGKIITVIGDNLDSVLTGRLFLLSAVLPPNEVISEVTSCQIKNSTLMICVSPKVLVPARPNTFSRYAIGFAMDNVTSVKNLGHRLQITIVPDPQFQPFKGIRIHQGDQPLILDGTYLSDGAEPQDYKIYIGTERCFVTLVDSRQLVCAAPKSQPPATDEKGNPIAGSLPLVSVTVGKTRTELGLIEYASRLATIRLWVLVVSTLVALIVVVGMLVVLWKKRSRERERDYKKIQLQMEHLESNVRKECKQAFAELQTSMTTCGTDDLEGPSYVSLREFVSRLLWIEGIPSPSPSLYASTLPVTLAQFDSLLSSKHFVFALVESAESDNAMGPSERTLLSSLLLSALLRNMHYLSDVVLSLLSAHIAKTVQAGDSELLFRRSDSVVEKMTSQWLTLSLYRHVQHHHGDTFFNLYKALKYLTEKGPVDAVTGESRYTINEAKLLREAIESPNLELLVMNLDGRGPYRVRAVGCDTVSQLKHKVLDILYRGTPHSHRPFVQQFDLEWDSATGVVVLSDESAGAKGPRKLNTLTHFGLQSGALLHLRPSKSSSKPEYRHSDSGQSSLSSLDRSSPIYSPSQYYHLSPPSRTLTMEKKKKIDGSIPKSIPEVYLTRLLTSKGTVSKYIDDFLESVLFEEESTYPPILKFMFDYLDEQAARNGVTDPLIVQQWKSNLYSLRVWANLVKNPRLLFDVGDQVHLHPNLTVVAQTLVECFSYSESVLGAHSPSSRLLFAKEVSQLRPLSVDFFRRVRRQPKVSEAEFKDQLTIIANELSTRSSSTVALSELLSWVRGNGIRITEVLSSNPESVSQRLPLRLSQVLNLSLEPEHIYCTIPDYSQAC